MIFPPIPPLGTVVEMRNGPYRCHQPLRPVCDRRLHEILPQPHEVALIQDCLRLALPHHPHIVAEFRVDAQ